MDLVDFELIPSVVDTVDDPDHLGRVKCTIPGVTNNKTIRQELMPWVMPLHMNKYQSFSKMLPGTKVWVLSDKKDNKNLWYFPYFEEINTLKGYLDEVYDNQNVDVLIARNLGGGQVLCTYDDTNGIRFIFKETLFQMKPNGDILINNGSVRESIENNIVNLGYKSGNGQQAVKGNILYEILSNLSTHLMQCGALLSDLPFVSPAGTQMINAAQDISPDKLNKFLSDKVKIYG